MADSNVVYRYEPTFLLEQQYTDMDELLRDLYGKYFEEKQNLFLGIFLKEDPTDLCGLAEFYDYRDELHLVSIGTRLREKYWKSGIGRSLSLVPVTKRSDLPPRLQHTKTLVKATLRRLPPVLTRVFSAVRGRHQAKGQVCPSACRENGSAGARRRRRSRTKGLFAPTPWTSDELRRQKPPLFFAERKRWFLLSQKTAFRQRITTLFPASSETGGSISRCKRQTPRKRPPILAKAEKQVVPTAKKIDLHKEKDHLFCRNQGKRWFSAGIAREAVPFTASFTGNTKTGGKMESPIKRVSGFLPPDSSKRDNRR